MPRVARRAAPRVMPRQRHHYKGFPTRGRETGAPAQAQIRIATQCRFDAEGLSPRGAEAGPRTSRRANVLNGARPLYAQTLMNPSPGSQPGEDCGSRMHLTVLVRQATERRCSYSYAQASTANSFRKEGLQPSPDDSNPPAHTRRDWATRARWPRGNDAEALETVVGAHIDSVRWSARAGAVRED